MSVSLSVFCTNHARYSKFGFEKNAFGFEIKTAEVPSLRQEESVSMNDGLRGRVWGGGSQTFLW